MNPISLLCEIIAQGGKVSSHFYRGDPSLALLVRHGFLCERGVMSSVVCDGCDEAHAAPIVYVDGRYGYFCPDLGFCGMEPRDVTMLSADIPHLINTLADVLGCRQRKSSSLRGMTWRIGVVTAHGVSVMLHFHPRLKTENDAQELKNVLVREVRSERRLVVTAQGGLPLAGTAVVCLENLFEMDAPSGELREISDIGLLAGVPNRNTGGRPSVHAKLLVPLIEDRIQNGTAVKGLNLEAREVLAVFKERYPEEIAPSQSTLKRFVLAARGGS